ncbi:hypothetical protein KFE25_004385 [Diacronema lutheri]|uniref:Uncharacterized protein n=2 Tax=Diacronema lutheri TaxID=2081491 RepID=A0A8J5X6I0_DIALT|nr:hypothetical protein KFE25_004385 [Diacronema lutheri]
MAAHRRCSTMALINRPLGVVLVLAARVACLTTAGVHGWIVRSPAAARNVAAWDGVFGARELERVRALAHALGADRHVFSLGSPSNALERAIDSLALQLRGEPDGAELMVEYWARASWMHLEAHRDCDEFLNGEAFRTAGGLAARPVLATLRYPLHAHVLYLDVGADVLGPTCVFDDCEPRDVPTSPAAADACNAEALRPVALQLLPVFRRMHVVPASGEAATTRGYGDEGAALSRQVLLFNLWAGGPPLDVVPAAHQAGAGADADAPRCAPLGAWRPVRRQFVRPAAQLWPPAPALAVPLLVSMLGPRWRRGYHSRVFCARAPRAVRAALGERSLHSVVELDWFANLVVRIALLSSRMSGGWSGGEGS